MQSACMLTIAVSGLFVLFYSFAMFFAGGNGCDAHCRITSEYI